jgi:hypothetical protein
MDAADTLVEVLRNEGVRVLATLARTVGDLAVAEDALSEATITALDTWPRTGILAFASGAVLPGSSCVYPRVAMAGCRAVNVGQPYRGSGRAGQS